MTITTKVGNRTPISDRDNRQTILYLPWVIEIGLFVLCPQISKELLKLCYVPATSATSSKGIFHFFLLQPLTVLIRQTWQAVRAIINESIFLRYLWLCRPSWPRQGLYGLPCVAAAGFSNSMFVQKGSLLSFVYLVGQHTSAVSFPPSDIYLAQLACSLSDVMFCLHSLATNRSLYKNYSNCKTDLQQITARGSTQPPALPRNIRLWLK